MASRGDPVIWWCWMGVSCVLLLLAVGALWLVLDRHASVVSVGILSVAVDVGNVGWTWAHRPRRGGGR